MRLRLLTLLLGVFITSAFAVPRAETDSTQIMLDSLEASFHYQTGEIKFTDIGSLNVPKGFRYLNAEESQFVLQSLWGNPEDSSVMGMLVPQNIPITSGSAWAFIITYDAMGYVDDDDAEDIDYDEMLTNIQSEEKEINEARAKEDYPAIHMIGWAAKPYYDKDKKVLHWAKELKFGDGEINTLNYNVRILGRKGVLVMNAVAGIDQLAEVQANIDPVLSAFTYTDGNTYSDFNPGIDKVAAWTIGGLVAGKVLAKVGIFALLLKNIKLVALAIAGAFGAVWRWFKRKTEPPTVRTLGGDENNTTNPPV